MLKKLFNILLFAFLTAFGSQLSAQSIKASLDSSQITMGYQTAIRLDIVDKADAPSQVVVDKAAMPPEVEVIDWVYGDTTDIGNGLVEMKRALIVQSFDSGVYTIPPFLMIAGPDTLRSKALTLKGNPVDVSKMTDINPIASPMSFESRWYDFLPDWLTDYWGWLLAAILLIAAGISAYLILTKKVDVPLLPKKKPLPPYELAMQRLNSLRELNLWQSGREKEYYTRLIDILRDYLQGRFGINAMEMTSQQITRVLQENETTRMPNQRMKKILEIADFVKFAKVRPLPEDNTRAFNEAMQFVEETRPVEEPTDPDGKPVPPQETAKHASAAVAQERPAAQQSPYAPSDKDNKN